MSAAPSALETSLRAVQAIIMAADAPCDPAILEASTWTEQKETVQPTEASTRAPATERLRMYRQHILKRLTRAICSGLPRAAACLGAACEGQIRQFFAAGQTRSLYLRDVVFEFVAWAAPRWRVDPALPPYVVDLARYELAVLAAARAPDDSQDAGALPLALDQRVRFSHAACLYHFEYAVHQSQPGTPPAPAASALLFYRDRDGLVQVLALSSLAAAMVAALMSSPATLGQAVVQACQRFAQPTDETILVETAQLLADLAERGVVLGAEPGHSASDPPLHSSAPPARCLRSEV
jgi:hypothetical protein